MRDIEDSAGREGYDIRKFVLSEILRNEFGGYWTPQEKARVEDELDSHTYKTTPIVRPRPVDKNEAKLDATRD